MDTTKTKIVVHANEKKPFNVTHLRESGESSRLAFFYIGADESMFNHFNQRFECGYQEGDFNAAANSLFELYLDNNRLPDVVFIDLPFNEEEISRFSLKFTSNILLSTLPVIYNEKHLTEYQVDRLNRLQLIDDIYLIYFGACRLFQQSFVLKQSKLYDRALTAGKRYTYRRNHLYLPPPFYEKVNRYPDSRSCHPDFITSLATYIFNHKIRIKRSGVLHFAKGRKGF